MASIFEEVFPYYLSIGMTADEFWRARPSLCRAYRKKRELDNQRLDLLAWMIGGYVYEVMADMAPLYNVFNRRPKPMEYAKEPRFFLEEDKDNKPRRIDPGKDEDAKVHAALTAFMRAHNKKMRAKEPKQVNEPEGGTGV